MLQNPESVANPKHRPTVTDLALNDFLQGLLWTMEYLTGRCLSYNYHFPHVVAPAVVDLLELPPRGVITYPVCRDTPLLPVETSLLMVPSAMSKWLHPSARKYKTPMRDLTLEDAMSWKEIEKKIQEVKQNAVNISSRRMRKFFPTLMFARNDYLKSLNSFDHYQHQFAPPSPPAEGFRSIYNCSQMISCFVEQRHGNTWLPQHMFTSICPLSMKKGRQAVKVFGSADSNKPIALHAQQPLLRKFCTVALGVTRTARYL